MEVVHPRCAGIDVSKKDAKVYVHVRVAGRRSTTSSMVTTWTSMAGSIVALREHLIAERVTCVVIESTRRRPWKPFYFVLEDALNVMLVNARHVRNVPGRKTDVSDAAWLAELGAHGLVRASFVPPEPIRVLRDLTRARATIAQARTKEIGRLWRRCWKTPGSNCRRWRVRSPGCRGGPCLKRSSRANATRLCWPIWLNNGYARRSPH